MLTRRRMGGTEKTEKETEQRTDEREEGNSGRPLLEGRVSWRRKPRTAGTTQGTKTTTKKKEITSI